MEQTTILILVTGCDRLLNLMWMSCHVKMLWHVRQNYDALRTIIYATFCGRKNSESLAIPAKFTTFSGAAGRLFWDRSACWVAANFHF